MAKLLLVEDEKDLAKLVADWLTRDHHLVEVVHDGDNASHLIRLNHYDLIILDIMLPGLNGVEICKQYREGRGATPILLVTAKDSIDDKTLGLDAGADDYVTKPFNLKELSARVRALLRRSTSAAMSNNYIVLEDVVIDTANCKVSKSGQSVHLLPKEFRLLEFLARHPNQVFDSEELLSSVWESDTQAFVDTVRGHIQRLRKKLDTPGKRSIISTVHGLGYKIETGA